MAADRDDLLRHYRETRADLLAAIDRLTDDQFSERTLDGWSMKDHLLHICLWDEIRAAEFPTALKMPYISRPAMTPATITAMVFIAFEVIQCPFSADAWRLGTLARV